jgi:hypothetical protein
VLFMQKFCLQRSTALPVRKQPAAAMHCTERFPEHMRRPGQGNVSSCSFTGPYVCLSMSYIMLN